MLSRARFVGFGAGKQAIHDPERERHLPHVVSLLEAQARKEAADQAADQAAAEDARDRTQRCCRACGVVGDDTVEPRTIGAWRNGMGKPGARLCIRCAKLIVLLVADEFVRRVRLTGDDETPNGDRRAACAAYLSENETRFLP